MNLILLCLIFFTIATLYSSVGFGGGSSYIAILFLIGLTLPEIRLTALICNIVVVGGSSFNYIRKNLVPWKKIIPIIICSVPLAFIGGTIQLEGSYFKILAATSLIVAAALMFIQKPSEKTIKESNSVKLGVLGSGIGLLSGLIGIGGGIFLAPVLHLLRWETAKTISIVASLFILVNSMAGLLGQLTLVPTIQFQKILWLIIAVFLGGQIGNRANIQFLQAKHIRILTALLIAFVGIRILIGQLTFYMAM